MSQSVVIKVVLVLSIFVLSGLYAFAQQVTDKTRNIARK